MKISYIHISNFKSIRDLTINEADNALILVGKNNTGKTTVLDAILAAFGKYEIQKSDFLQSNKNIVISMKLGFTEEDISFLWNRGMLSKYKRFELWEKEFKSKIPSYRNGQIYFECTINPEGRLRYSDGYKKNNPYIKEIFPKVYHIDHTRNLDVIQNDVLHFYDSNSIQDLREDFCMFDKAKKCNRCFTCIGRINQKTPEELTVFETAKLLEYKVFHTNIKEFSDKINYYFHINGCVSQDIEYVIDFNVDEILKIDTQVHSRDRERVDSVNSLSEGLRSIYALSLLEAYIDEESTIPCIIMIEDPEIYLHPQLQKIASEILYRLSKKNQVIFSTHSPNMIFNFSSKQIKQVILDEDYYTSIIEDTNIDEILDDLGYTANDLMNVSFVFIVEGKQDGNRLPLLLEKYYSEIQDEDGNLQRIAIIPTNSCTNIKTYANLKYINKVYLKDQFLMIRDSDGKNPEFLARQLCRYYDERSREDFGNLPRITPKNVLILKYYSFENYFLDPKVMVQIGVLKKEEDFYRILFSKYNEYLYKLVSTKKMIQNTGISIKTPQDLKDNIESIKIYVRGHNLFDIFYGRYHGEEETGILKKYIEYAPKNTFEDIIKAIDAFVYFENRKK